jgi:hypothetical protein
MQFFNRNTGEVHDVAGAMEARFKQLVQWVEYDAEKHRAGTPDPIPVADLLTNNEPQLFGGLEDGFVPDEPLNIGPFDITSGATGSKAAPNAGHTPVPVPVTNGEPVAAVNGAPTAGDDIANGGAHSA